MDKAVDDVRGARVNSAVLAAYTSTLGTLPIAMAFTVTSP
jgi:hypothetical protein